MSTQAYDSVVDFVARSTKRFCAETPVARYGSSGRRGTVSLASLLATGGASAQTSAPAASPTPARERPRADRWRAAETQREHEPLSAGSFRRACGYLLQDGLGVDSLAVKRATT